MARYAFVFQSFATESRSDRYKSFMIQKRKSSFFCCCCCKIRVNWVWTFTFTFNHIMYFHSRFKHIHNGIDNGKKDFTWIIITNHRPFVGEQNMKNSKIILTHWILRFQAQYDSAECLPGWRAGGLIERRTDESLCLR